MVEDIKAGWLSTRRAEMIMALPRDGSWGKVPIRSVAIRAWSAITPPIIDHFAASLGETGFMSRGGSA